MRATSIARGCVLAPVWRRRILGGACALVLAASFVPPAQAQFVCVGNDDGAEVGDGVAGNTASGNGATAAGGGDVACGTNATASGGFATAYGFGATATGNSGSAFGRNSMATSGAASAYGVNAEASGNSSSAFGANSTASGIASSAYGRGSTAAALDSSAYGDGSMALGVSSTAIGNNAFAAGQSDTAVGHNARVEADNSSAFGAGATVNAGHSNSTAIGTGAQTTRANQVALGTSSTTYTMPGITSGASRAAQGTPTHLVTSNASGDLAAYTPAQLGLATAGDIAGIQSDIDALGRRDEKLTEGLAAVASLAQPIILPGQTFAMRAGWGGYDDASAVAFTAAGVVAKDVLRPGFGTVVLDGGVGVGTNEGEVAGRAGFTFGW